MKKVLLKLLGHAGFVCLLQRCISRNLILRLIMDNLRWRNISLSVLATTATWPCPRYVNDYHEPVLSFDIAKGGLTDDHVLILPIGHQASQVKDSLFLSSF